MVGSASDAAMVLPSEAFSTPAGSRVPLDGLPPDVLTILDELHEEIDSELETMGRKAHGLQESSRIQHDALRQAGYRVKRFEDLLSKRQEAELAESGVFTRVLRLGGTRKDPGQVRLEASLAEEFRKLGEVVIDLHHKEGLRFAELDTHYRKIEGVLERVRDVRQSVE